MVSDDKPYSQAGWRFVIGIALMIGGYAAWSLIPLTVAMHMHPGAKSTIAALLGATPFVTKLIAVALMGRPAYELFKRDVWKALRRSAGRAA